MRARSRHKKIVVNLPVMKGLKTMRDGTPEATQENWRAFTLQLRDDTQRQIVEMTTMQAGLQQWYSTKPGKLSETLELDECPALLRVMQVIRLLRETLLELDEELAQGLSQNESHERT
jgi:hypothetical protein